MASSDKCQESILGRIDCHPNTYGATATKLMPHPGYYDQTTDRMEIDAP